MNNLIPTLRSSLTIVVAFMGLIAIALVIITGTIYQNITIDNQRQAGQELVKLEVNESLGNILEDAIALGLSINKRKPFYEAFASSDKQNIQEQLNSQFHQYFVTAGILQLEKLILYDRDMNPIVASSEGFDISNIMSMSCGGLLGKATSRKGSERLKPIHELCMHNGRSILSVLVPVGGLVPKAYLQVIVDLSYSLKKIEFALGLPVQLREPDGEITYKAALWPISETELETSLISEYHLISSTGEEVLIISAARNLGVVYGELNNIRTLIIISAVVITVLAGVGALLLIWWTAILPMKKLQQQVQKVGVDKKELGKQVELKGVPEIVDLASGFNQMTTALKALYEDLTESYKQLESETSERIQAVNSNEAKTEFLSRMSHELRTPLNAILGFTELMMVDTTNKLDSTQKEQMEYVYNAGEHLLSLVNELLDLESIEAGKLYISSEAVEVNSIIEDALSLLKPAASARNIKLLYNQKGQKSLIVMADPARLKQVMLNLLSNAVKYNNPYGDVTIDITPTSNNRYKCSIIDTGPGLSQEEQNRLFIPFSRVGKNVNSVEGTGIGLTITKRFVELMGGEAGVYSVAGEGATFWFTLQAFEEGEDIKPVMHG